MSLLPFAPSVPVVNNRLFTTGTLAAGSTRFDASVRILFGPEHDACHIEPANPSGYEWWYFDAISDDGRWALVSIYFLGTPMSPYYKSVIDGRRPKPADWCGVFISLHENVAGKWRERAYAYNIYRNGQFSRDEPRVSIGASTLGSETDGSYTRWRLNINERALWRGNVAATMTFTAAATRSPGTRGPEEASSKVDPTEEHTWVCAAPQCRADGALTLATGETVPFSGNGYHDHNFGMLPFAGTDIWYWGRATVRGSDAADYLVIYYDTEDSRRRHEVVCLLFDADGNRVTGDRAYRIFGAPARNAYGLEYQSRLRIGVRGIGGLGDRFLKAAVQMRHENGVFSEGPFYRRLPFHVNILDERAAAAGLSTWTADGAGICEVFRPARLCGPIASRAMWSRMRRRRS